MKITSVAKVMVLKKVSKNGVTDPSRVFYSLLIMSDDDCGSLNCTDSVYNSVSEGTPASLILSYGEGSKGGYIRATGVVSAGNK